MIPWPAQAVTTIMSRIALPGITALLAWTEKLRPTSRSRLILASAAALTLVLRYALSKDSNYISNLSKVGKLTAENATKKESEEYDIIIVGGGKENSVYSDGG